MGGDQRKDCNDVGCGRVVAECHAIAFCDNQEGFIGTLRRDGQAR